jgi:hypothetical protein
MAGSVQPKKIEIQNTVVSQDKRIAQLKAEALKTERWVMPVFCLLLVFIAAAIINPMRFTVNPYFSSKVLLAMPIAMIAGATASLLFAVHLIMRSRELRAECSPLERTLYSVAS